MEKKKIKFKNFSSKKFLQVKLNWLIPNRMNY